MFNEQTSAHSFITDILTYELVWTRVAAKDLNRSIRDVFLLDELHADRVRLNLVIAGQPSRADEVISWLNTELLGVERAVQTIIAQLSHYKMVTFGKDNSFRFFRQEARGEPTT